jgi:hypothetical protein
MELTWKLFGIVVKVEREQVEDVLMLPERLKVQPPSEEQRREIERQHTLASGNRYVGPIR